MPDVIASQVYVLPAKRRKVGLKWIPDLRQKFKMFSNLGAPYQSVIESILFHLPLPLDQNARRFSGCYGEVTARV